MDCKRIYDSEVTRLPEDQLRYMTIPKISILPIAVDLRDKFPDCFDQGNLRCSASNAITGMVAYDKPGFIGSRLFNYYCARANTGPSAVNIEIKVSARAAVDALEKNGICLESSWQYDISKFAVKPSPKCFTDALQHKAIQVRHIPNDLASMKNSLAKGLPFIVSILLYSSFESIWRTGIVPMPAKNERLLGGHTVVCVGYIDSIEAFVMRNSYGTNWGNRGYFYLPYTYLTNIKLTSDLWTFKVT